MILNLSFSVILYPNNDEDLKLKVNLFDCIVITVRRK